MTPHQDSASPRSSLLSRHALWGGVLFVVYAVSILKLQFRPTHHLGNAMFVAGVVIATALIRRHVSSSLEKALFACLAVVLAGCELHDVTSYRRATQTFIVCDLRPDGSGTVRGIGPTPITDVTMHVIDMIALHELHVQRSEDTLKLRATTDDVPLARYMPGEARPFQVKPLKVYGNTIRYRAMFTANNGMWWEDIEMRRIAPGKWVQRRRVARYHDGNTRLLQAIVDPEFPGAQDEQSWNWTRDW